MTEERQKLAYAVFRGGCVKNKPRAWDNLEPWMRDAMAVVYLQGKLDGFTIPSPGAQAMTPDHLTDKSALRAERDELRAEVKRLRADIKSKQIDDYGLALMMIAEGCAGPQQVAKDAIDKWNPKP